MKHDPLASLFVSAEWLAGYKAGRAYEACISDREFEGLFEQNDKKEKKWHRDLRELARLKEPKRGIFGLKNGRILLNRTFATRQEAESFAEFNSKGRGGYTVVDL